MPRKTVFDLDWLCRTNEELDEKLPTVASMILSNNIDFNSSNPNETEKIVSLLSEQLFSFAEMTYDEVQNACHRLTVCCQLMVGLREMETSGEVIATKDGKFKLSKNIRKTRKK